MQHRIVFEAHGQDFLEGDVIDGVVIDCRPLQSVVWNGTKIDMTRANEGQLLPIITASGKKLIKYSVMTISRTEQ